ncbi:MAG: RsmF rRNA methyltransferase first C-terminal domain-containing protein [Lachnospiraceae bacterium]|nr:RsmF rRNA methyltransferase first C-terminal domain-containing protein [Lachnospiraceae bacterium]
MNELNQNQQKKVYGAGGLELPEAFCNRMKQELGGEAEAFLASYRAPRQQALRLNPAKYGFHKENIDRPIQSKSDTQAAADSMKCIDGTGGEEEYMRQFAAEVLEIHENELEPVPWARHAYYFSEDQRPGRNPLHDAGLYYIQEPSAMATVGELEDYLRKAGRRGPFRALDLCAAPGGKSTQLLTMLREFDQLSCENRGEQQAAQSILVSNEIIPSRAAILSENLERFGAVGTLVTNESPERLAARFPSYFDLMVVDAPCSGEGMFRKEEAAVREWSPENVAMCAQRQRQILEQAAVMLADGGVLAYSTCTFSQEENEQNAAWLAETHPELKLVQTRRLYPHQVRGEGHFVALFQKDGEPVDRSELLGGRRWKSNIPSEMNGVEKAGKHLKPSKNKKAGKGANNSVLTESVNIWNAFASEIFGLDRQPEEGAGRAVSQILPEPDRLTPERAVLFGEELSLLPAGVSAAQLAGLKVLRPGLHLGTVKKNRFEPSHALALALTKDEVIHSFELDEEQAMHYLRGETIPLDAELKGCVLVTYRGVSIGWGKAAGGILKNHYPKGLRRLS